jgi:hypothetical protein
MTTNSSAQACAETPHATNSITNNTISDAVRRRAQSLINDRTIGASGRAFIRYTLEINDPYLPELVRRVDAGESIVHNASDLDDGNEDKEKIEALAEMLCRAGDGPETKAAALLVLMATIENATDTRALVNTAKLFAFNRCGELNCYGMVDTQIAALESELLVN